MYYNSETVMEIYWPRPNTTSSALDLPFTLSPLDSLRGLHCRIQMDASWLIILRPGHEIR